MPRVRLPFAHLAVIASFVLLPGAALAQPSADEDAKKASVPTDRWSPELSMMYRQVGGTAISPSGDQIAYVVREPVMDGEKSEYLSQIWLVSADGSRNAQYTRGEKSSSAPAFSPDGKWLAFISSRGERPQVWAMPVDGGEAQRITDAESGVSSFKWSNDGARIAYLMNDPKTDEEKAAEKEKRAVILVDRNYKYSHIYVVPFAADADGERESKRVTEGDFDVQSFDWSPDGKTIVFARQPDPRINTGRVAGDIMLVTVADGRMTELVGGAGVESSPLFSPDGRLVAFLSTGDQPEPVGLDDVYVIEPKAGAKARALAKTPDRSPNLLGWSHDGSAIFFTEIVHTQSEVMRLPVDGGAVTTITRGDGLFGGASFDGASSRMAFVFENSDTPGDVFISPVTGFSMKKLTSVNADVAKPPMGRTELVTWASKDGMKIEGLLTYPVGYKAGSKVPLILNVHGGPGGAFTEGFTGDPSIYMLQYFAQEGFAILRPNPRGSTGYGKEFRYANVEDWGFGDYQDLMTGVDKVIAMGVAHPDSLLEMGWSYGGYMTSWIATQTDRFKAVSMGAGLPDLVSMMTTTDIGDYLVGHLGGAFWENMASYEKHSPIMQIAKVTTPVQVIHGAEDLRVPTTQGQEFYRALQRRGVPTEMILLPRTPHGPREPKLLMAVSPLIMKWFESHLRGGTTTMNEQ
jgi:dipeptidyl aminopeptidase/acylaminoacyl peptidase